MRPYASFLVRCWSLATGERRVKVEHIQSGEFAQAGTLEDAVAWLSQRLDEECALLALDWEPASSADGFAEKDGGGT
jgi:hypothetical protein